MKINCDYCGGQIDTDKYDTCPNCGGSYGGDRELIKEKEKLDKADDLLLEKQKLENERLRIENENLRKSGEQKGSNAMKALGIGCAVPLMILGIVFVIIFVIVMFEDETGSAQKTTAAEPSPRITGSITISIDPISIPDIPEIPEVPEINIEPDIPDIGINTITAE